MTDGPTQPTGLRTDQYPWHTTSSEANTTSISPVAKTTTSTSSPVKSYRNALPRYAKSLAHIGTQTQWLGSSISTTQESLLHFAETVESGHQPQSMTISALNAAHKHTLYPQATETAGQYLDRLRATVTLQPVQMVISEQQKRAMCGLSDLTRWLNE